MSGIPVVKDRLEKQGQIPVENNKDQYCHASKVLSGLISARACVATAPVVFLLSCKLILPNKKNKLQRTKKAPRIAGQKMIIC
jgi:hypothetical protein